MRNKLTVNFVKDDEEVKMPEKANDGDVCYDLYSCHNVRIAPWSRETVSTGIRLGLPDGYEAQIRSRSGLAASSGIMVLNSPGTIDTGYRGIVEIILFNSSLTPRFLESGSRIAQIAIRKVPEVEFVEVESEDELGETQRSGRGFGSSGI